MFAVSNEKQNDSFFNLFHISSDSAVIKILCRPRHTSLRFSDFLSSLEYDEILK